MSKFCGNCGAQLDDDVKVCGFCGVTLSEGGEVATSTADIPGISSLTDQLKTEKSKKIIKIAGIGVAAIVVLVIVISIISSVTGYKGAVKKIMNAFEDYDVDTLISMTSSILTTVGEFDDEAFEESIADRVSNKLDEYESDVGNDPKISYEIIDAYDLPERKIDQLIETLEAMGYEPDAIKKIKQLDLEITVEGSRREKTYDCDDLYMIKEDGGWKALYVPSYY